MLAEDLEKWSTCCCGNEDDVPTPLSRRYRLNLLNPLRHRRQVFRLGRKFLLGFARFSHIRLKILLHSGAQRLQASENASRECARKINVAVLDVVLEMDAQAMQIKRMEES